MSSLVPLLLSILSIAAFISLFVFWIISIVQVFSRNDLKNNKWLWLVLIVFLGNLGSTIFFFVENRKKLGGWSLVPLIGLPVLLSAYAIISFALAAANSANVPLEIVQ